MGSRSDLHTILKEICSNVYFQPPPKDLMQYPCIVYNLNNMDTKYADNNPYTIEKQYSITIIDKDPDSLIPDQVAILPKCIFERRFIADNLNHFIFNLFF